MNDDGKILWRSFFAYEIQNRKQPKRTNDRTNKQIYKQTNKQAGHLWYYSKMWKLVNQPNHLSFEEGEYEAYGELE